MKVRWCGTHDVSMFIADSCYAHSMALRMGSPEERQCVEIEMELVELPDKAQAYFEMEVEYQRLHADLTGLGMTSIQAVDAVELVAKWLKAEGGHQGDV